MFSFDRIAFWWTKEGRNSTSWNVVTSIVYLIGFQFFQPPTQWMPGGLFPEIKPVGAWNRPLTFIYCRG